MGYRFGPGRTRRKLAETLVREFSAAGIKVRVFPENLWPAEGYWRTSGVDCHAWDGQGEVYTPPTDPEGVAPGTWRKFSFGSYDTMTDCARGLSWDGNGLFCVEIHAKDAVPAKQRFKRYSR